MTVPLKVLECKRYEFEIQKMFKFWSYLDSFNVFATASLINPTSSYIFIVTDDKKIFK